MTTDSWTSRDVEFDPFPRTSDEKWEAFYDSLAEYFWEKRPWYFHFDIPGISSCSKTITVSGFPWYLPKWVALRVVCNLAAEHNVGGDAEYKIRRSVLVTGD